MHVVCASSPWHTCAHHTRIELLAWRCAGAAAPAAAGQALAALKDAGARNNNERVFRALFASDEPLAVFIKEVCEATGGCFRA